MYGNPRRVILFSILLVLLGLASFLPFTDAAQNGPPAMLDDLFSQVASRVPSFGGMFLDGGTLKVYLTNPTQKSAALTAITQVFGPSILPARTEILQARYGFLQLRVWHDRLGGLFDIAGVVLTDIDEGANRLKIGVDSSASTTLVEASLGRSGVPREAVVVVQMDPFVNLASLRDRIRPLRGGIQIAFSQYLCTLGFNGIRAGTAGFVVNSHCTDKQGGVESTQHYQPNVAAENFIGTEIADPLYTKQKCPSGARGKICRWSDSAYSQLDSAVTADLGFIARTDSVNTGSLTIAGAFRVVSEGPSLKGQVVNKVGRTTGWSQGQVTDTCVNVSVLGSKIMQRCQDIVSASVGAGDSGSPVFSVTNSPATYDVQLRGILWGGNMAGTSFVYSPIANIERSDELGSITTCASGFSC